MLVLLPGFFTGSFKVRGLIFLNYFIHYCVLSLFSRNWAPNVIDCNKLINKLMLALL